MEMGFSKEASEKALFFTLSLGGTTEKALDWITQHQEDADFNEELRIVGKEEGGKPASTMSKEEKLAKVQAMIEENRKKKAIEEEKSKREAELNRIKFTKELQEAKKKMEE